MLRLATRRTLPLAIAIAAGALASPPAASAATIAHPAAVGVTLTARVVKVTSATSFTMKLSTLTYTVKISASTKVTLTNKPVKLSALKAGELAKVTGSLNGSTLTATVVSVTTGALL